jgi:pimeloyl-ACP methyl ester carboxylesterase
MLLSAVIDCAPASLEARRCGSAEESASSKISDAGISASDCRIIYAGFVGAMETSEHKASGIVQIRDTLRGPAYPDVCAKSFLPYNPSAGYEWILSHFPAHPGPVLESELQHCPRIILAGHSTGGWAMLSVARELRDKAIPVELTIQVDSVGIDDVTVPSNVKEGAIFHAHDPLMFMTTKRLKLEDSSKTKIVANILVKGAGHLSITRDPRIRALVVGTIERLRGGTADSIAPAMPTSTP